jgi:hypothetical protein
MPSYTITCGMLGTQHAQPRHAPNLREHWLACAGSVMVMLKHLVTGEAI